MAGNERLGARSPASLVATDTYLMRELLVLLYPSFLPITFGYEDAFMGREGKFCFTTEEPIKRFHHYRDQLWAVFNTVFDQMLLYFRVSGQNWLIKRPTERCHRLYFYQNYVLALLHPKIFSFYSMTVPVPHQYDFTEYFEHPMFDFENIADCTLLQDAILFLLKLPDGDVITVTGRIHTASFAITSAIGIVGEYDTIIHRSIPAMRGFSFEAFCAFEDTGGIFILTRMKSESDGVRFFRFYRIDLFYVHMPTVQIPVQFGFVERVLGRSEVLSMHHRSLNHAEYIRINYLTREGAQRVLTLRLTLEKQRSSLRTYFDFDVSTDEYYIPVQAHAELVFPHTVDFDTSKVTKVGKTGTVVIENPSCDGYRYPFTPSGLGFDGNLLESREQVTPKTKKVVFIQ